MLRIGIETQGLYSYNQEPARLHNELAHKVWIGKTTITPMSIFVSERPYMGSLGYEVRLADSYAGNFTIGTTVATYFTRSARQAARIARKLKRRFNVPINIWRLYH